jgi:hypothetical protein
LGESSGSKIELGDLQKIVAVSSSAIAPAGRSIVIIVSRVNFDQDLSGIRHLLLRDTQG